VRCQQCGLYYVDLSFSREFLREHPEEQTEVAVSYRTLVARRMCEDPELDALEDSVRKVYFRDRLRLLEKFCDQGGRLLDVGCGRGVFLELARNAGFEPFGVELAAADAEAARRKVGTAVVATDFEQIGTANPDFDVITLFHVIEHFRSPSRAMAIVSSLLKPGGLVIIETPRIDTLWFRLLGRRWREFMFGHLFFFSRGTLADLLKRHGFTIIESCTPSKVATVRFVLNRAERILPGPARAAAWLARTLRLADVRIRLRLSDTMLVCARKVDDPDQA
jgi:2-polyprenyl-3-methyl-5-hydroxy-6-metoxy-1,4-benzoquinol methylase